MSNSGEYTGGDQQENLVEPADVARVVFQESGIELTDVQAVDGGDVNSVYFAETDHNVDVVVRLMTKHPDVLMQEQTALYICRQAGIPVPATMFMSLFDHEDSERLTGYTAFEVQSRLEGTQLNELTSDSRQKGFELAGTYLARLHSVDADSYGGLKYDDSSGRPSAKWIDEFEQKDSYADIKRAIVSSAGSADLLETTTQLIKAWSHVHDPYDRSFLHGDFLAEHIFITDEDQMGGFIDFQYAQRGDPVYDIAWLLSSAEATEIEVDAFMEGYTAEAELGEDYELRFNLVSLQIELYRMEFDLSRSSDNNFSDVGKQAIRRLEKAVAAIREVADDSDHETKVLNRWQWPETTIEIGGATTRIEYSEAERIFDHVEIRGDGRVGRLTPDLLEQVGLMPHHRLEVEDCTVWFSQCYDIGGGRPAVIGYVQTEEGSVVARSYYRSNSQGVWRYLPQYKLNENSEVSWYSKGYGEESLTLPAAFQEGLTRSLEDDGELLQLGHKTAQTVFAGTARHIGDIGTVYHRKVAPYPRKLIGIPDTYNGLPDKPENLVLDPGQSPEFRNVVARWEQDTDLYGRITNERFESKDGSLTFVFSRDRRGRAWISSIENHSPIESTGLRTAWMSGGALSVPAYEYSSQTDGYGNMSDRVRSYEDMFKNYLSRIPVIQDYLSAMH